MRKIKEGVGQQGWLNIPFELTFGPHLSPHSSTCHQAALGLGLGMHRPVAKSCLRGIFLVVRADWLISHSLLAKKTG